LRDGADLPLRNVHYEQAARHVSAGKASIETGVNFAAMITCSKLAL
jgi:hypothetical protein